ncbi:MAG TPA: SCO family protein [Bryobacteraceae bacterium]|nr:SCO family protein [Bryobacteraceae bacterium]
MKKLPIPIWFRFAAAVGMSLAPCYGALNLPPVLQGIGIEQRLNSALPLDTEFRDETGASVPLRKYFGARPVLLAPVYYRCPMLCSQILSGVVAGLRPLSLQPGRDFDVVVFSFNPDETAADAAAKRDFYTRRYSRRAGTAGWHFLTGSQASIDAVTKAIGFHYRRDPQSGMFIHASGVMIVTPEGRLARYLYGVEYQPKDLKLALMEASHNRIGTRVDQVLLFCYHYDPSTGKYTLVVLNLLKGVASLTVIGGALALMLLWRGERKS